MEERICVLSQKLEENKREMALTRAAREKAEEAHRAELERRRQVAAALVEAEGEAERVGRRAEEAERERGAAERERGEWERATVKSEEANAQLSNQIEYMLREMRKKEQEIGLLDNEVGRKTQELEEANETIAELQAEVGKIRGQFREELEGKERENRELKRKIKEHKDRLETEGINLKFEEASKLKKFI
jgi:chromosome segregation ATPase